METNRPQLHIISYKISPPITACVRAGESFDSKSICSDLVPCCHNCQLVFIVHHDNVSFNARDISEVPYFWKQTVIIISQYTNQVYDIIAMKCNVMVLTRGIMSKLRIHKK